MFLLVCEIVVKMYKLLIIFSLLPILAGALTTATATEASFYTSEISHLKAGKFLKKLHDPSGELTFPEAQNAAFTDAGLGIPNFGITTDALWFKGALTNDLPAGEWFFDIDFSTIDEIDLYLLQNGKIEHKKSGQAFFSPSKTKVKPSFRVFLHEKETLVFYFRIRDGALLSFPLVIRSAIESQAHYENELIWMGLYFGALAVMLLYNFFIFITIKDKSYLFYSIYLLGMVGAVLCYRGFADLYLWPESSIWWKNYAPLLFWGILYTGNLFFMFNFLGVSRQTPLIYYGSRILIFYSMIATIFYAFLPVKLGVLSWVVSSIPGYSIGLAAGIIYYLHGFTPARFYLLGSLTFLITSIFFLLKLAGLAEITFFTEYGFQVGSMSEAILLSIALADRISAIQQEKEEIRIQAMAHEKESLKNLHRFDILKLEAQLLDRDLDKARRIQMGLIPTFTRNKLISGLYLPMEKVGGDYYDIMKLDSGGKKTGVFICDVSGHGISAALISVMIKGILHNLAPGKNKTPHSENLLEQPGKLMQHLNTLLFPYMDGNFVSAFYGIIDKKNSTLFFASAAHPPPFIITSPKNGDTEAALEFLNIKPQGLPLGVFSEKDKALSKFPDKTITLPKKSRMILYSDGFTDTIGYDYGKMNEGLDSFKETVVHSILSKAHLEPVHRFTSDISQAILLNHKDTIEDDICALCIEV